MPGINSRPILEAKEGESVRCLRCGNGLWLKRYMLFRQGDEVIPRRVWECNVCHCLLVPQPCTQKSDA